MNLILMPILQLLHTLITLYIIIIIIAAVMSFIRPDPYNPFVQAIYKLTEPLFDFIRQKMPFVVISGIDLSPIVILLALQFIDNFILQLMR
jgi:YggT family protein